MAQDIKLNLEPITREQLQELEQVDGQREPLLSIYLNIDVKYQGNPDAIRIALKDATEKVEQQFTRNSDERALNVLRRFRDSVSELSVQPNTKSLVAFLSDDGSYDRVYGLPWPVPTRGFVGERFVLWPLEEVLQQSERYAICLVGHNEARAFLYRMHRIEELEELTNETPGKIRYPEPLGEHRFHRRHIEKTHQHLEKVAKELFRRFQRRGFENLIIGGPEELHTQFEEHLHPYLSQRLIARWTVSLDAGIEELRQRAEEEEQQQLVREARAIRDRIEEERRDRIGLGLDEVAKSVWESRVQGLVLYPDLYAVGGVCNSCGRVTTGQGWCPECGAELQQSEDIVSSIVLSAIDQAARVRYLPANEEIPRAVSIASLNRF